MHKLSFIVACLLCVVLTGSPNVMGADQPPVQPKVHNFEGRAILAPEDWQPFKPVRAPVVLHLIGDGRQGIPMFDGALSVLKAGLNVEVFPRGDRTLQERVDADMKELMQLGNYFLLQPAQVTEATLADGTRALVLDTEFIRSQNGRVSFQCKVYCEDDAGRHLVATGFTTSSRAGRMSVKEMGIPKFVRAHALSMVLDAQKADTKALGSLYKNHKWQVPAAIAQASEANDRMEKREFVLAIALFREAIKQWDKCSAAHNGLAWALMNVDRPAPQQLEEALREAQVAVKLTEEQDAAALDTLALAYQLRGDKEQAIKAINQAIKLQPKNTQLHERLKSLQ